MMEYEAYDVISSTPDYRGIEYSQIRDRISNEFGIPKDKIGALFVTVIGWYADNQDKAKDID